MRLIEEMPTIGQVELADDYLIVSWHLFLRPVMMNSELDVVKAIARKYDSMAAPVREALTARARRDYV